MLLSDPPARLYLRELCLMNSRRLHIWVVSSEEADRISLIAISQERVVDQVPSLFLGSNRPPLDLLSGPPKMLIFLSASQSMVFNQRHENGPEGKTLKSPSLHRDPDGQRRSNSPLASDTTDSRRSHAQFYHAPLYLHHLHGPRRPRTQKPRQHPSPRQQLPQSSVIANVPTDEIQGQTMRRSASQANAKRSLPVQGKQK